MVGFMCYRYERPENTAISTLLSLELWKAIADEYVEDRRDVSNLSLTCLKLRDATLPTLYRTLTFKAFDGTRAPSFRKCVEYLIALMLWIRHLQDHPTIRPLVQSIVIKCWLDLPRYFPKDGEYFESPESCFSLAPEQIRKLHTIRASTYEDLRVLLLQFPALKNVTFAEREYWAKGVYQDGPSSRFNAARDPTPCLLLRLQLPSPSQNSVVGLKLPSLDELSDLGFVQLLPKHMSNILANYLPITALSMSSRQALDHLEYITPRIQDIKELEIRLDNLSASEFEKVAMFIGTLLIKATSLNSLHVNATDSQWLTILESVPLSYMFNQLQSISATVSTLPRFIRGSNITSVRLQYIDGLDDINALGSLRWDPLSHLDLGDLSIQKEKLKIFAAAFPQLTSLVLKYNKEDPPFEPEVSSPSAISF